MKANWVEKLVLNNLFWAAVQRRVIAPFWGRSIQLPQNPLLLEIGCGRGSGAVILVDRFSPSRVDALDVDEDMLKRAEEHVPSSYRDRIHLVLGDVTDVPAEDASYDAVFDFFTLQHVGDWRKGLSEVSRVLKPGGFFAFAESYGSTLHMYPLRHILTGPEGRFERADLVKAFGEEGLRLMEGGHSMWGRGIVGVARKNQ